MVGGTQLSYAEFGSCMIGGFLHESTAHDFFTQSSDSCMIGGTQLSYAEFGFLHDWWYTTFLCRVRILHDWWYTTFLRRIRIPAWLVVHNFLMQDSDSCMIGGFLHEKSAHNFFYAEFGFLHEGTAHFLLTVRIPA
jgi:hypothetical protein